MNKKGFQKEHKTGIIAVLCLLLGAVVAFAYMYLNGNSIVIMNNNDEAVAMSKNKSGYKKDGKEKHSEKKRYNIYNYYYQNNGRQVQTSKLQTDTLPSVDKPEYVHYRKNDNKALVLDLNSCDTLDLQMIKGIGPAFSRRICNYRRKLGGYTSVEQLREIYGMEEEKYQSIKRYFVVGVGNKKLNINTLNIKELASHPYIDYPLAKEIIIFRQNHGAFTDIEQIKLVHLMDDTVFNKLSPYISLE